MYIASRWIKGSGILSALQANVDIDYSKTVGDIFTVWDDCSLYKRFVHTPAYFSRAVIEGILEGIDPSSTQPGDDSANTDDQRKGPTIHSSRLICVVEVRTEKRDMS